MNTKVEEALGVFDAVQDVITARVHRYNGKANRDAVAGKESHPETLIKQARAADLANHYTEARTTIAAHIAQQDATIARMREALEACVDYGSMTDDGWVTDKARAALNQGEVK